MIAITLRKRNRLGIVVRWSQPNRPGCGALTTSTMFGRFQQAFPPHPYGKTAEGGKMTAYEPRRAC
ncbi:hypothetical protein CRBSH125_21030 [Afipia carboxidovorans]|nr:hypothetical protein CRBSH125_21030 [Afipia carboxidovorans]